MTSIRREDLTEVEETISLVRVDHLASYNWIEAETPTITVPGCPALWLNKRGRQRIKQDSGWVVIAQNADRHPESPLEPLFRALLLMQPTFRLKNMDVITDRNNLRKLLTFVDPHSSKYAIEEFTIDVEVVNQTVLFARTEIATREFIGPTEFRGYGHEFERANTSEVIEGSTGHHRIIHYKLGDLNILLRCEVDGYVGSATPTKENVYALASMAKALGLDKDCQTKLKILIKGKIVNPMSTLEIKTRALHKPLSVADVAPQLWLSSTCKLVRAYHNKGVFAPSVVEDVTNDVKIWERNNQLHLKKLVHLLQLIKQAASKCQGQSVLHYNPDTDLITIVEKNRATTKSFLPPDLYKKWSL